MRPPPLMAAEKVATKPAWASVWRRSRTRRSSGKLSPGNVMLALRMCAAVAGVRASN